MNNEKIVVDLVEKIKDIEKEESKNYLGQISATDRKKYQRDVVGRILAELENSFENEERQ